MNSELPDIQAGFRKGRDTRDQIANIQWIIKKQENSRKTSTSALLIMPKPLIVWITTKWKILQQMGIPDHLTCLLRNLYAAQEATVRTGHGTTNWFKIRKGAHQSCILSSCLFICRECHVKWVQLYSNLTILWHFLYLRLESKRTFSSPVATAVFSKFAGILSAVL